MSQDISALQPADEIDLFELLSILIKNTLGIAGITAMGFVAGLAYSLIAPPTYQADISFSTNYNSIRSEILCFNAGASCKAKTDFKFLSDFEDLDPDFSNLTAEFTYKTEAGLANLLSAIDQRFSADSKLIFEDANKLSAYLQQLDKGIEPDAFIVEQRIRTNFIVEKFESGVNFATIEHHDVEKINPKPALVTVMTTLAALIFGALIVLLSHYYQNWKNIRE